MDTSRRRKINQLLLSTPKGVVLLSSWLKHQGYSPHLVKRYRQSGWLESIGVDANIRAGDEVGCLGALYALQFQMGLSVHPGARSALAMLGKSHYLELDAKEVVLFGSAKHDRLPAWFKRYDWEMKTAYYASDFLPSNMGLLDYHIRDFSVKISGEIRALMECLYLAPRNQDLSECYELMESMNNVHPKKVQLLLEHCISIKVKRLFLCLSEKIGHEWFHHLDLSAVDLGSGKRVISEGGVLDKKYQITVPKSWSNNDKG